MILFYLGHLQNERERPDMERKHMNSDKAQRKEPELATDGGGTNIQSKQACLLHINPNQRFELSPRSPCAGVATGLLKHQEHSLKNRHK